MEVQFKVCRQCMNSKNRKCFGISRREKDGLQPKCKHCRKIYSQINKEVLSEKGKVHYNKNKSIYSQNSKNYYNKNKEKIKEKSSNYSKENKDKIKIYKELTKIKRREKNTLYSASRRKNDSFFKLKSNIGSLIRDTFKRVGKIKDSKSTDIIKCDYMEFKIHVEKQFLNWMSWDNYGKYNGSYKTGWDLDHIIPLSYAKTEEEFYLLNHWSNFQPLCSRVNRYEKKDKIFSCSNLELNLTIN